MRRIERALISVYDKTGIVDFARTLVGLGVEIVSTGGTARLLASNAVPVREVSDLTGFPEILDGRVKTLNPRIAAGLLAIRENPQHMSQIAEHRLALIDLVCVNLYPFVETIQKPDVQFQDVVGCGRHHKNAAAMTHKADADSHGWRCTSHASRPSWLALSARGWS